MVLGQLGERRPGRLVCWSPLHSGGDTHFLHSVSQQELCGGQGSGSGLHVMDPWARERWASVGLSAMSGAWVCHFNHFLYERTGEGLTGSTTLNPLLPAYSPLPPPLGAAAHMALGQQQIYQTGPSLLPRAVAFSTHCTHQIATIHLSVLVLSSPLPCSQH